MTGKATRCAGQCDATPSCVAFTYFPDDKRCKLKSALGDQMAKSDRNTFVKVQSEVATAEENEEEAVGIPGYEKHENMGSGEGNVISTMTGKATRCAGQCDATPSCVAFTYFPDDKRCKLKSALGDQMAKSDRNTFVKEVSATVANVQGSSRGAHSLAINALAALGLAVSLYGAFRHFTKST